MSGKVRGNRKGKNSYIEVPCVIGIDQSYARTGISIAINGRLVKVTSEKFEGLTNQSQKRNKIRKTVSKCLEACLKKFKPEEIVVIVERIRTYTTGFDLYPNFLKSQGALISCIVDTSYSYGVTVRSVDTRCWKSRVLGSSKPIFPPVEGVKDPQKFGSVQKVIDLGFKESLMITRGKGGCIGLDDDAADSACIALYGSSGDPYNLIIEQ